MQLSTYFEKFVSNIQPSDERIAAVSESHTTLRAHLKDDAKLTHPISDSFLSGSYARHTAIDPIKDADIILVLEETKVSADRKTPNPRAVLEDLKNACDESYERVNLETQRRSIRIELPDDDVLMDIVPAIAPNDKDKKLFVPDYQQGVWIESHPSAHLNAATETNAKTGGQFVRTAKAFKWWRGKKFGESTKPKSFLLETIVAIHIAKKPATNLCVSFEATAAAILAAYATDRAKLRVPVVPDPGLASNDLATSCGWSLTAFQDFYDKLQSAHAIAVKANLPETKKDETIRLWQSLFGADVFPSSLTEEEERGITESLAKTATVIRPVHRYAAKLSARICPRENEMGHEMYPSNGRKLPKGYWLRFRVETTAPGPHYCRWTVRNHGAEARRATDMGHSATSQTYEHRERLAYRGHHYLDCEVIQDGQTVARARHIVNIA